MSNHKARELEGTRLVLTMEENRNGRQPVKGKERERERERERDERRKTHGQSYKQTDGAARQQTGIVRKNRIPP